ncbi:MAG: DUF1847 domain-containing protein [Parasporobacterium sp.]|nr:DUF1847 domain-containing protein [Parasporobacterium sp.]
MSGTDRRTIKMETYKSCCERSCIDCGNAACQYGGTFPEFCSGARASEETFRLVIEKYNEPENLKFMQTAAAVEYEGYCKLTRVEEIADFAGRMGYKRLGIATCVGLIREARTMARYLRHKGFEVFGIGCKVGQIPKQDLGIPEECNAIGVSICNPILQAELLGQAGTEFNIVMGLCVGHDTVFYKYSQAPVTTLITKDRVTCHNPAAVLYNAETFYKKKLFD